jgi:RimJ/RimL family protein N-acetyltransferase
MRLTYRTATPADVDLYFAWANDPDTRRQSFQSELIPLETHRAWFARRLADPNSLLLVFENEANEPVGQVRLERNDANEVTIGLSVDPCFRGQGLASQLIELGCTACVERWESCTIFAFIKPDNQPSMRAFERAGFTLSQKRVEIDVSALMLVLSTG